MAIFRILLRERLTVVALAAGLMTILFSLPAFAHTIFTNEPAGLTPLAETALDTFGAGGGGQVDGFGNYGSGVIIQDPTAPVSPPNVLLSTRPASGQGGSKLEAAPGPGRVTELFVGMYVKPSAQFQGWSNLEVNKFATWMGSFQQWLTICSNPNSGDASNSRGTGTVTKWCVYNPQKDGINTHLSNIWRCDSQGAGSCTFVTNANVSFGQWTKIEYYVQASSCPTCRDGVIRYWVNGQLALSFDNYNSGTLDGANSFLDSVQQAHSWDAADPVYAAKLANGWPADAWSYDHIYVSTGERTGGGTGAGGSTGGSTGGSNNGIRLVTRQAVVPRNATVKLKVEPKMSLSNVTIQLIGVFQEEGFQLTGGTYVGGGVWNLTPDDLADLAVIPPPGYCGSINASLVITQNV